MNGKKLKKAGWGIFSIGLAMTIGGGSMYTISEVRREQYRDNYNNDKDYRQLIKSVNMGGLELMSIGSIFVTAVSIPLLGVGYHRTNHAYEVFNEQCATPEKLTLNLQASQNGLGLALNF